jgi:hypothetical protein
MFSPADYKKIIGSGVRYTDDYYNPASLDLLRWTDFPRNDGSSLSAQMTKVAGFFSPTEKNPKASLYGAGISPNHII